jgi:Domain of unknown function (DUF4335)
MTIKRQYSLPNCTLILEGFGDGAQSQSDLRPVMSILTNAECYLSNPTGKSEIIRGGKDFFESLITAVSHHAQEFLSGVHLPESALSHLNQQVQIQTVAPDRHRMTVTAESQPEQTVEMSTVQFFDLAEAIDQFVADTQTLPKWSINLAPVPKRYAPKASSANQVVPVALGASGLVLAAAAMWFLPNPTIKRPSDLTFSASTTAIASPATPPSPPPTATPAASPSAQPDLTNVPEITDPKEVERLALELEKQVSTGLNPNTSFTQELLYRVSVGKDGKILGYRSENTAATDFVNETPLPNLRYNPVPGESRSSESIASLRLALSPGGKVKVSPWDPGILVVASPSPSSSPSASLTPEPSPTPSSSPIASPSPTPAVASAGATFDGNKLKEIQPKLYEQIDQAWKKEPTFSESLQFEVRTNAEGKVVEFVPNNQAARDYQGDIPLGDLGKISDPSTKPQDGLASFKVVFTPGGKLEINPWNGYDR